MVCVCFRCHLPFGGFPPRYRALLAASEIAVHRSLIFEDMPPRHYYHRLIIDSFVASRTIQRKALGVNVLSAC